MSQFQSGTLYRSIAANQSVIRSENDPKELKKAVKQTLLSTARGLADYYHFRDHPDQILERVHFDPQFDELFHACLRREQRTLMLILHMGNFDLGGQAIARRGLEFQILSYAHPGSGYQNQNTFRQNHGLIVTPISVSNLRLAEERLKQNGTVLTGIDRPDPGVPSEHRPMFFGRPALLSDAFIRLSMRLNLTIHLIACEAMPNGHILVKSTPRLPFADGKYNDDDLVRQNMEMALGYAETWLRQHPEQWSMTYPVWAEETIGNQEFHGRKA
jgi:lauroyl/myristoyl acyltransferase